MQNIIDWLVNEGPRAARIPNLMVSLIRLLNENGFELIRASLMVRTLHPEIESIRYSWISEHADIPPIGKPFFLKKRVTRIDNDTIEEMSFSHGAFARSAPYQVSPFKKLDLGASEVHIPVHAASEYPIILDLHSAGGSDYFVYALPQLGAHGHRVSFATKKTGGFTPEQISVFRSTAIHLALALELQVSRLVTETLMAIYLGQRPAEKVLAGKIKPGDVDAITSAIWFSDLRGYTDLSQTIEPATLVEWLNGYFETISGPIIENGGEILKYMGDAVLAIFPVEEGDHKAAAEQALVAARKANAALAVFNETRAGQGQPPMRHGIALHIGDVQYGNVGANRRLDFTVIGPTVNKAARIESLCKETGRDLLFSRDFSRYVADSVALGEFNLKGIKEREAVFAEPG